jgi:hypothetical protein
MDARKRLKMVTILSCSQFAQSNAKYVDRRARARAEGGYPQTYPQ